MADKNQKLKATVTIGSAVDSSFNRGIDKIRARLRGVGQEFRQTAAEFGRWGRNVVAVGTAAGAAAFAVANSTASLGDEVAKTADNLGLSIEGFQELRYAAERSGVAISTFDSSMTAMTRRLGDAVDGTGPAADALEKLGLSAQELVDLAPEDALGMIADGLQKIESPAERASVAAALFSRAGIGMVNMLRDGSDGLDQLREDARKTGYVLSEETARDAEAFKDALLDTQLSLKGLKNTLGSALMPVITEVMGEFSDYLTGNRDDVEAFAAALASGVREAIPLLRDFGSGVATVGATIGSNLSVLAEFVGGWDKLGVGMALLVTGAPLMTVAKGLTAIGVALAANPIGAAMTAIGLAAVTIYTNWDKIRGKLEPIFNWLGSAAESITQKFEALMRVFESVRDFGRKTVSRIGDAIGAGVRSTNSQPRVQPRASGGRFVPGALLVGEEGPELRYETQGGYIADAAATRRMLSAPEASRGPASVVQNITINAQGLSAEAVAAEIERRGRQAQDASLYDGASDFGTYGGGYG